MKLFQKVQLNLGKWKIDKALERTLNKCKADLAHRDEDYEETIDFEFTDDSGKVYPYCLFEDSDNDGDGWGWENKASCVMSEDRPNEIWTDKASGEVLFENKNLFELETEERAHKGIFLAFQYPLEIPGVNTNILKVHRLQIILIPCVNVSLDTHGVHWFITISSVLASGQMKLVLQIS